MHTVTRKQNSFSLEKMLFIAIKKILKHLFSIFMNFFLWICYLWSKQFPKLHQNAQLFETELFKPLAVTQNAHRLSAKRKASERNRCCLLPKFTAHGFSPYTHFVSNSKYYKIAPPITYTSKIQSFRSLSFRENSEKKCSLQPWSPCLSAITRLARPTKKLENNSKKRNLK